MCSRAVRPAARCCWEGAGGAASAAPGCGKAGRQLCAEPGSARGPSCPHERVLAFTATRANLRSAYVAVTCEEGGTLWCHAAPDLVPLRAAGVCAVGFVSKGLEALPIAAFCC